MDSATQVVEETKAEAQSPIEGKGAADIAAMINIPRPLVKMEETAFHFKKDEYGNKRETIKLHLPFVTLDGLVEALSKDEKVQSFVLDVVNQEVYKAARSQVGDDNKPVNTQAELDLSKLTLDFLANQPKAERTGGGISKEVWAAFAKDYMEVMPGVTGKDPDAIGNAVKILVAKLQPAKTNKPVLTFIKGQLALWFSKSPNAEEFQECFEFLDNKIDTFLAVDEATLLANL